MDTVIVTNWKAVDKSDFYLSARWAKLSGQQEQVRECRKAQKQGNLFEAWEVGSTNYCIYSQMDATKVFIHRNKAILLYCDGEVIGNEHTDAWDASLC